MAQSSDSKTSGIIQAQANPFRLFDDWFKSFKALGNENFDAVNVSTLDLQGHPESRIVLMRRWNDRGFSFFTNYQSTKSKSIEREPWGHYCFHWQAQERQIRIQGVFEKTTVSESDDYWNTRPRESQINALASAQSSILEKRADLEERVAELERKWGVTKEDAAKQGPIPRPAHWGGWRLVPWKFEFWLGHQYRLHDRVVYQRFSSCPDTKTLLGADDGGKSSVVWNHFRIQP